MKHSIDWRIFSVVMVFAALIAVAVHALSHLNFWVCLLIVILAIVANGILATIEDELPGGFHNPKPDDRDRPQ